METAFSILVIVICLSIATVFGALGLWALQLIVERFIHFTLPSIVDLYGRIRYPDQYKD